MDNYNTKSIRNICLLGHGGGGKTSLAESMLYVTRATDRLGTTPQGNTVCDYDPEEIKRGFSLSASMAPVYWNGIKINILDTPGYLDFAGEVKQCVRVADAAVIVVDGKAGVEVGTELAWDYATGAGIPKSFFINKFDDPEARFYKVFGALRDRFGVSLCPIIIPIIDGDKVVGFLDLIDMKDYFYDDKGTYTSKSIPEEYMPTALEYRNMLYESIAQTSEELMEKFFEGEEISREEAVLAIHEGIIHGDIVPVFCGSTKNCWAVGNLLDTIADSFPRPTARKVEMSADGDDVAIEVDGSASIFVFKTVADPFVGKMSFFKVMNGSLKSDMTLTNLSSEKQEKLGKIYTVMGKKQIEVPELCCGDIGMIAKLANTNTSDTLALDVASPKYASVEYPASYYCRSIAPQSRGDEDKISSGISRLLEEDPTLRFENNAETKQLLVYGMGDIHLDVIVSRLKSRFGTSVVLGEPTVAYREAIKKSVSVEGKHKKQSGGHGQYGHVKIEFSPGEGEGLTFTESVFGGSVPKNFFPAVEKGLQESMQKGVLAGFPMVSLKANLFDGSYHDVDSSEMAFKIAASLAYKEGMQQAMPVLLEPVCRLDVLAPESMVGDVMGDLNKRRGRVLGMEPSEKAGYTMVQSEVPQAEVMDYTVALRAMTQGRGSYTLNFERYEEVPAPIAKKIIADNAANLD